MANILNAGPIVPVDKGVYSSTVKYSILNLVDDGTGQVYLSRKNNNLGNSLTDEEWWGRYTGKSAYELAVENGYEGTEAEWLESLRGGGIGTAVLYTPQTITDVQKAQARNNIGALGSSDVSEMLDSALSNTVALIRQNVQAILDALGEYAFPNGKPEIYWSGEMPYDAEIEYLESTGTQYIDTLLYGNENTEVQIDFIATSVGAPVGFSRGDNTNGINIYVAAGGNSRFGDSMVSYSFEANTRYNVIFKNGHFIVNGVDKTFTVASSFATPTTLTIFKTNLYFSGKVYSAKIIQNGNVVMDLIPVRVGTTGYMYDNVTQQLYANAGAGDFILGNDKNA